MAEGSKVGFSVPGSKVVIQPARPQWRQKMAGR